MYDIKKATEQIVLPADTVFDAVIIGKKDGTVKEFVTKLDSCQKWVSSARLSPIQMDSLESSWIRI